MLRLLPPFVALGLCVLALLGIVVNATTWLSASDAVLAFAVLALTGLVPANGAAPLGAGLMMLAAVALTANGIIALATAGSSWLAWWTLVFAVMAGGGAVLLALGETIERMRCRALV
jgi:hypothetical protein